MAEGKDEEKRPGESAWVTDPERQKQMLYQLSLQLYGRHILCRCFLPRM
jgi:hypothetical protein